MLSWCLLVGSESDSARVLQVASLGVRMDTSALRLPTPRGARILTTDTDRAVQGTNDDAQVAKLYVLITSINTEWSFVPL